MLSDRGDDVVALLAIHLGDTLDGEVVAFRGARGEDDLLRSRANQLGDVLTRRARPLLPPPIQRSDCGWQRCRTSP